MKGPKNLIMHLSANCQWLPVVLASRTQNYSTITQAVHQLQYCKPSPNATRMQEMGPLKSKFSRLGGIPPSKQGCTFGAPPAWVHSSASMHTINRNPASILDGLRYSQITQTLNRIEGYLLFRDSHLYFTHTVSS